MNVKNTIFGIAVISLALSGCDPKKEPAVDDYEYFPLRLNHALVYQVTETRYSAAVSGPVVTSWQEKDEAIRRTESVGGFPVFVMSRSRRNSGADTWQKTREYTVTRYPDKYLMSLDNITTVPVIFPVWSGVSWDLNAYNTREGETCTYNFIDQERTVGDLHFNRVLQVSGRDHTNDPIVRYNLGFSQYALGVGLIYDEQTDYEYCQEERCFGQQQVISGVSTVRELVAYESDQ